MVENTNNKIYESKNECKNGSTRSIKFTSISKRKCSFRYDCDLYYFKYFHCWVHICSFLVCRSVARPISLTCISSKLMEHIIASSIMRHADNHNILYPLQHGFRNRRSCETQLLGFVNDLINTMHAGSQTDILVMDFSKAFDKVSHPRLVTKLKYSLAYHKVLSWVHAYSFFI